MHDIICPHCGESFIASDVAFDLSEYVLSLLYNNPKDGEDVKSVGFKYYVDEDTISKNTVAGNKVPLICDRPGGPDIADSWYPFVISNKMILQYIAEQVNIEGDLNDILADIKEVHGKRGESFNVRQHDAIRSIYSRFFTVAQEGLDEFDIDDANVQIAIKILLHIFTNQEDSVTVRVRIYSSKLNKKYRVPDILFVLRNGVEAKRHYKCCRYCGTTFPSEYGYYKMMPVVLMGSHYSGKTSYLLSLLYTVNELPPFSQDGVEKKSINVTTLNEDNDLIAFSKNIEKFKNGQDPDKTDFTNVPILNLLADNIIYTFIDWPGEKFIDGDARRDVDFVYQSKSVIRKARHFLCFLEPSQIDLNRVESEEKVRFSAHELAASFSWHMGLGGTNKLRSITYVVNKVDIYSGDEHNGPNPNANMILELVRNKAETSVYAGGRWNENEMKAINDTTCNFMQTQNPGLFAALSSLSGFDHVPRAFIPVAPYGERSENHNHVHKTRLSGIPFLRIMELDRKLMSKN